MLAAYTFNTQYEPRGYDRMPSLRLLEGGKFCAGEYAPVLVEESRSLRLKYFQWGLVSTRMQARPTHAPKLMVAAEQALSQPAYQGLLRRQRCLIPADGFYTHSEAQTFKLTQVEGDTFGLAGIYEEHQQADGSLLRTFAVVTVPSPQRLQRLGLCIPLILPRNVEPTWLSPYTDLNKVQRLLQLPSGSGLCVHPVQELRLPEVPQYGSAAA
jgi:putative SOS response-associated peptidase YedK